MAKQWPGPDQTLAAEEAEEEKGPSEVDLLTEIRDELRKAP